MPLSTAIAGDVIAAVSPGALTASPGLQASKYQIIAVGNPKDLFDCKLFSGISSKDTPNIGSLDISEIDPTRVFNVDACRWLWFGGSGSTNASSIGFVAVLWASEPDGTLRLMGVSRGLGLTASNHYVCDGRYVARDTDVLIDLQGASKAAIVVTDLSGGDWNLVVKPM